MEKIPIRYIREIPQEPKVSDSFRIRTVEELLSGENLSQKLHRHDFYYVLALQKGTGVHAIDFTAFEAADHCVFFLRPGQVHKLSLQKGSTGYLMQFGTDFFYPPDQPARPGNGYPLLRKVSTRNLYLLDARRFGKVLLLLDRIFEEFNGRQERYREVIRASLDIFFTELVRELGQNPAHPTNLYQQEKLDALLELIETQVFSHKQVSYYADRLNLSPYQLNAITKATLGKTSSELIQEYVILEAKRYLLATSRQVSQIADHLGYEDISYFIRLFKKHTGHSPEAFRHNFR